MNNEEIRERLNSYSGSVGPFVDWMAVELERQLERNTAMLALLQRWVDRFGCFADTNRQNQQLVDDTKTLLKEAKEE